MTLTKADLRAIKNAIATALHEEFPASIKEGIKNLPTREEFFRKTDEILAEIRAIRKIFKTI